MMLARVHFLRPVTKISLNALPNRTMSKFTAIDKKIVDENTLIDVSLNRLHDNPGAKKKKIRVGRGGGSRRGKTAGRGTKGQKARQGGRVKLGFEGGQTPFYKRIRKYGFTNAKFARKWGILNLQKLKNWIEEERIDPNKLITMKTLIDSGCVGKLRKTQIGIKVLAQGHESFPFKINVEVSQASDKAIKAIQNCGGTIKLVHYDKVSLRALLRPEKFKVTPAVRPPSPRYNRKLRRPMVTGELREQIKSQEL